MCGVESHGEDGHKTARAGMRRLLEDIGCCPNGHYCTLKEILTRRPKDSRMMLQIKCIEKLKYERSEREGRDIGWDEAFKAWIEEGRAAAFARVCEEGRSLAETYRAVMGES